jgi:hypothetical protein
MPHDHDDDHDALIAELAYILRTGQRPRPDPHDDDHRDHALDDAVARHYARQQEGLPPPAPSTAHLRIPHRRYLRKYYPVPRPPGGWVEPIPTFEWFLQHEWPAVSATAAAAPPDPAAPVQLALPGLLSEE